MFNVKFLIILLPPKVVKKVKLVDSRYLLIEIPVLCSAEDHTSTQMIRVHTQHIFDSQVCHIKTNVN